MKVEIIIGRKIPTDESKQTTKPIKIDIGWSAASCMPLTLEGNAEEVEMFLDLIKKYYTYH